MVFAERIKRLLPRNRFVRSVSVLAGGTATAQAIVVLASPLLTRLYSPEDFGVLAVYAALLGILTTVASLRYQLAIPLPETDQEAANVVVLGLLVVLLMTMLTAVTTFFFDEVIAETLNTPGLARYLWLLPVGLSAVGVYQVFNYWAIRVNAFPAIARTKLAQAFSMVGIQVGGYLLGPISLLLGQVSSHAAGAGGLSSLAIRKYRDKFQRVCGKNILWAARRYKRFPLYSSWGGLFNAIGLQLPPLIFASVFGTSSAGIYLLSHRVLAMPLSLISKAIAQVFFSRGAEACRNGNLKFLVASIYQTLVQIAMPPTLVLILTGPTLFAVMFGEEWRQAGVFAQWLAVYIYFQFITSPLSQLVSLLEKHVQGSIFQTTLLLTQVVGLIIGAGLENVTVAIALFAVGSACCYLGFLVWIIRASGNNWLLLWIPSGQALLWSGLIVAPLLVYFGMEAESTFWLPALGLSAVLLASRYWFLLRAYW